MKKLFQLLSFIFLLGVIGCENEIGNNIDSEFNSLIDVVHQDIELQIDWKNKQLKGSTKLNIKPLQEVDGINLNVTKMKIINVQDGYGNRLKFKLNDSLQVLTVNLGKKYDSSEELSVRIDYETLYQNQSDPTNIWGSFGNGVRYFKPTKTENERRKQLWVFGEPQSSRYWFPSNDTPKDLRTTDIKIKVQKPLMALSSGDLVSSEEENGTVSYHWKSQKAYAPFQTYLVVGEYANIEQKFEEIKINNYGYPDEKLGTKESVIRLPDMIKFFSDYTGQKYPYDEYSQIFVQDFGGWKPGLASSIITENMIDDKTTHEDFFYGWDLTEGEALAAQWFGSHLKPKTWKDVWLTKGFSRYFSGLYNQHKNGNTEFLTYQLSPDLSAYLNDWNHGVETVIVPEELKDMDAFVNGNAPYAKGARVLHMLRKELGEEKWRSVVKSYVAEYGGELVSTKDFINVVNKTNGKPLDWFFSQWVYGAGHPIFKVEQAYDHIGEELKLSIIQTQAVDSVVNGKKIPYFGGKLSVEIDGEIHKINLKAQENNEFTFSAKHKPKIINVDYEDVWIKEISFEKITDELLIELENSKDVLYRSDAIQKLGLVALDSTTEPRKVEKIKEALRNSSLNEDYWRMRLAAMNQLLQIANSSATDGKIELDGKTEELLLTLVNREESWSKAWTINFLGMTKNKKYVPIYLEGLKDYSDRVVFMSAIALGKSGDPRALDALLKLPEKPSWKNQSLISALYGLKELKDPRGYELAINSLTASKKPHWNLGTPIWDHRLAAAHALKALDRVREAHDKVDENFQDAITEGNFNDIFYNAQLVSILKDPRGKEVFQILKEQFEEDKNALSAIKQLENSYRN